MGPRGQGPKAPGPRPQGLRTPEGPPFLSNTELKISPKKRAQEGSGAKAAEPSWRPPYQTLGPGALGPWDLALGPEGRGARGPSSLGPSKRHAQGNYAPSPPPCHQSSPALPECYENKQIYKGPRSRKATQTGAMPYTGHHLPRGSAHDPSLLPFDNDGALALLERHRRAFFQTSSRDKTTSLRTQLFREIAVEMSQSEARPQKSHNLCSASFAPPLQVARGPSAPETE